MIRLAPRQVPRTRQAKAPGLLQGTLRSGSRYYGWRIVTALGVTTIISYGTSQYLFSLLVQPVGAELGASQALLGSAYAGSVLIAGLAGVALGPFLDRRGARLALSSGSLISACTLIALAHAPNAGAFSVEWAIGMGAGSALTYYPVTFTVIANWFQRDRARALARLTFYGAFASTVFYPLAAALIARDGWRGALVALAVIQLAIAFPLHALVVRRHPEDHGLHPDGAATANSANPLSGWTAPEALRSTSFWLITAAIALSTFATTAVLVLHVAYLLAQGYALGTASTLAGILGLAYLPGRWLFDRLAALVTLPRLLAAAIALEALAVALLSAQRGLAWVVAYIIAFGVAYGAMAPLRGALIASFYGRRAYGTIIAAQGVALALAGAAGPAALGAVADRAGYGTALWLAVAVLVVGAAVALLAVCADDQRGRLQRSLPLRPVSGDKHGRGR